MAKRKKKSTQLATRGFGQKNLDVELRRAEILALKQDWKAVWHVSKTLCQQYPQEKRGWEYLAEASFELGETALYQYACEGLFAADPTGENAYMLGGACFNNKFPLMALQTFRQALELAPNHDLAPQAREAIATLEPMLEQALTKMGLTEADGVEIALLHEQGQAYMAQGDYAAARKAEAEVLERHPQFMSTRNNLSYISWMEGDVDGAISIAQAILEREPDNIHALANLIRFLVISGNIDAARSYGERLKASHAEAWDAWTKKMEGLTYLANDADVVAVWREAQAADVEASPASGLFYHLSAVALARTGDVKRAIRQWKLALDRHPGFRLAQENLEDIRKPVSQRHGAWPFRWEQWLLPNVSSELNRTIGPEPKLAQLDKLVSRLQDFLHSHTDVMAMLPRVLERGGVDGQEFILGAAEHMKTPELLSLIKDFALGQNGSDEMRYRAATLAGKAQLLPNTVTLWLEGEWREVSLITYEFHEEPLFKHSQPVQKLLAQALRLLRQDSVEQAAEAEALLNEALELEPESPDLLYNLAMALGLQKNEKASDALLRDIVSRYPDYVFASAALAQLHLNNRDIEAADALLQPFRARDRFHFMEFSAFSDVYVALLLAKEQIDGVRIWLEMWDQVDPENPQLKEWEKILKPILRRSKLLR